MNYTYGWSKYNSSYKPMYSWERVYSAFQYRSNIDLNGYPITGAYSTYWGGGYVYEMRGKKSYVQGNLTLLQKSNWIDRNTRAVVIEFASFNPNIKLIVVAEIIVELLPTGGIVKSARFDTLSLFTEMTLFQKICGVLYLVFISFYVIQEISNVLNNGLSHLLQFWVLIEWALIFTSILSLSSFLMKSNESSKVSAFFKQTSGYGYYKLQNCVTLSLILDYSLAFCLVFGTLKFLKVFRFNKKLSFLGITLSNCVNELFAFGFMFLIIWISFAQLFHKFYHASALDLSTWFKALSTCFQMMLGKYNVFEILEVDATLGAIIYFIYNLMILIIIPLLISIINNSFRFIREETKNKQYDYHMVNHLDKKIKRIFNKRIEFASNDEIVYKDQFMSLNDKFDKLLILINDVRWISFSFLYLNYILFFLRCTLNN
jgi:hypothetical protein